MYYNERALGKVYLVSILLQATSTDDILSFYLRLYQSTGLKRHQTTEHLQIDFSTSAPVFLMLEDLFVPVGSVNCLKQNPDRQLRVSHALAL